MSSSRKSETPRQADSSAAAEPKSGDPRVRIERAPSLVTQVERFLRDAIRENRFPERKLPTEVELAEQLGVSRETVRRATETLAGEGLLVKYRRKGTFLAGSENHAARSMLESTLIGYVQADYRLPGGVPQPTMRYIAARMLDGALDAAGEADFELAVRRATLVDLAQGVRKLSHNLRLRGVIFASVGEEAVLRRVAGLGLPMILLDHDLHLPEVSSIRDDSAGGARLAVDHLAELGHRHIAIAHWQATDLNPWRLEGYRQALRDRKLPRRRKWELLSDLSPRGARRVAEELAAMRPRPTGIYCFDNSLAQWIITELRDLNLRVPEDVSVVGGGGEPVPGLSYHQADWHQIGRSGVMTLLDAIEAGGEAVSTHRLEPHTIIRGETTGPPPDDNS